MKLTLPFHKKNLHRNTLRQPERTGFLRFDPRGPHRKFKGDKPEYTVFDFDAESMAERKELSEQDCLPFRGNGRVTWINVGGLHEESVRNLCSHYGVHHLIIEDILNVGQRAKVEELGEDLYILMPMLLYKKQTAMIHEEQVSILMGRDFVISFQESGGLDAFNAVRERLRNGQIKLRSSGSEYLTYSLVDAIVDNYFEAIEQLFDRGERLEDQILEGKKKDPLTAITLLRREVMTLVRAIIPVNEVMNEMVSSENPLLVRKNDRYWRDVRDHARQASDYGDSLRDSIRNLRELHTSQINTRMNEVMKVFTMVATLLAPATVIGGIYGMNFDVIPIAHNPYGFWIMLVVMIAIPAIMLLWFRRKGWI